MYRLKRTKSEREGRGGERCRIREGKPRRVDGLFSQKMLSSKPCTMDPERGCHDIIDVVGVGLWLAVT